MKLLFSEFILQHVVLAGISTFSIVESCDGTSRKRSLPPPSSSRGRPPVPPPCPSATNDPGAASLSRSTPASTSLPTRSSPRRHGLHPSYTANAASPETSGLPRRDLHSTLRRAQNSHQRPRQQVAVSQVTNQSSQESVVSADLLEPSQQHGASQLPSDSHGEEYVPGTEPQMHYDDYSDYGNEADPRYSPRSQASGSSRPSSPTLSEQDADDVSLDAGTDYTFGDYSAPFDNAALEFEHHEKVMYFLRGKQITQQTRRAVEYSCLVEAGTRVTNDLPGDANVRNNLCKTKYLEVLKEFNAESDFESTELRSTMLRRFNNAKSDLDPKSLWKKYKDLTNDGVIT